MEEIKLDDSPLYDALSYSWGQDQTGTLPDRLLRIKRKASANTKTILVTRSVESALERLLCDGYDRAIWVDQISINQEDWPEKSRQMQIMGKIYEASSVVIVWLGMKSEGSDDCSDSDEAMRFLRMLVEEFDRGKKLAEYSKQKQQPRAAPELLRRSWFERAWTLEEAANARDCKVYCGNEVIDYDILHQLYRGCQDDWSEKWRNMILCIAASGPRSMRNDERPILAHIVAIGKLKEIKEGQRPENGHVNPTGSALMQFNRLRSCQTKDAKDKIYSLYYHLPEDIKNEIGRPEYRLPVEELYRRLATSQICTMGNLMYLAAAGIYRRNLPLPSWVPDYTHPETHYSLAVLDEDCFNRTGTHLFAAADQETASAQELNDGRVLKLRGRILGSVKDVTRPFSFSSFGDRQPVEKLNLQLKEIQQQYQECKDMMKSYQVKQDNQDPYTLLTLNLTSSKEVENGGPS